MTALNWGLTLEETVGPWVTGCRGHRSDKFTPKCSPKLNTWPLLSPWPEAVYELNYLGGGHIQGHSENTVAA